ncbi:Cupin domain-containing protein [Devosia crocina]|uniref:Cupin domain-containing protein n=1 Tax=Devosia crocina TaxID=429728 RepID=A0A1I7N0F2_9HYPH|nr:cupin domain-containing protein [Devosia crocina]SFV28150.1 Cupin domain-containing protein [Devosia crocina]
MAHIVRAADRPVSASRTIRFEGDDFGAPISFFSVDNAPGQGPVLHVHPYPETWIVKRGHAEAVVGGEVFDLGEGDIAIAPAHVPHRFTNLGSGRLEIICIHASGRIVQEDLE